MIAKNANFSASTQFYLQQTWAEPDMVEAHNVTTPDKTTANGAPIVDIISADGDATLYDSTLAGMTADLQKSFCDKATSNPGFAARGQ